MLPKILEMPLVNIHQPCDEYMRRVIQEKVRYCKSKHKVSHLLNLIKQIPEFKNALNPPMVVLGSANNNVGRVALVVVGGNKWRFSRCEAILPKQYINRYLFTY